MAAFALIPYDFFHLEDTQHILPVTLFGTLRVVHPIIVHQPMFVTFGTNHRCSGVVAVAEGAHHQLKCPNVQMSIANAFV